MKTKIKNQFFTFFSIYILTILVSLTGFLRAQEEKTDTLIYKTETIEVEALRGIEGVSPITLQNVTREKIEKKYWMQDFPMFLFGNTSVNAYSESGASVGYSYLSIRGFDQRRISILINGIPQNDAEDHQVYWVDLSDITASIENIQIQRGIGTALYGASSIGGVLNIQTIDYFRRKFINISSGYGSYNSKRFSFEYSSGTIKDGYGFYAKFSKTMSDGYRDLSWSNHWSYFISAGKVLGGTTVIKANIYGAPIRNHLAYLGVTREYIDGLVSGDKRKDRKINFLNYIDETDNYYQPHYELVINTQPIKNLFISNTISYIRGDGYFITSFPVSYGYDFDYFRLEPFYTFDSTAFNPLYYRRNPDGSLFFDPQRGYEIIRSDIVSKLYVNNDDVGWYPKIQYKHSKEKGILTIGGEIRLHKSEHYGEITFGNALPPNTPPNYRYYYFNGKKRTVSAYLNEVFNFTDKFAVMGGIQYVNHQYKFEPGIGRQYRFSVDYSFFTPRFGINYNLNKNLRTFFNFSIAKREPRLKDIYDGENPYANPNFRRIDTVNNLYDDPLVKPEEMQNYELGIGYVSSENQELKANLNFYLMDFKNEIVSNGQLDIAGQPINGNASRSIHRGIEFEFEIFPFKYFSFNSGILRKILQPVSFSGNINLSQNYFKEYREILGADSLGNIIYGNDYSDNKILLTPDIISNVSLNYYADFGLGFYISLQYVGKQYLDNSENERKNPAIKNSPGYIDKFISDYTVVNAGLSLDLVRLLEENNLTKLFKSFELRFKINNLFDRLYEMTGSVDAFGIPYWIPAAERNLFFEVQIKF